MGDSVEVVLLDLGGIVVEFTGISDVGELLRTPLEPGFIRQKWLDSEAIRRFETGAIDRSQFGELFVREWELSVGPDEFLAAFRTWNRRLLPGVTELLAEVRSGIRLVCLSNSNELHWEQNVSLGINKLFEACFSSHELGLYKPDAEVFNSVVNSLGVHADRVVFFDDNQVNVDGGIAAGIDSYLVAGVEELRGKFGSLGILERG